MKVARCVEIFVQRKQACGYSYISVARVLRQFARFVGHMRISSVTDSHLNCFLNRGKMSNNTWRHHSSCLVHFFRYWLARRQIRQLPMPKHKHAETKTFFPYVYSREEIRKLLNAVSIGQQSSRCGFGVDTLKTIILFLYGSAMRIDDALALSCSDVDFTSSCVKIRNSSVHLRRVIPIGGDLREILQRYLESYERRRFGPGGTLFLTVKGKAVEHEALGKAFRRLRTITGIKRTNSLYQPRLQDLRHTFAVHSIEQWISNGDSLQKMLPKLATYMGKVDMQGLERYLELTPCNYEAQLELLKTIAPLSEDIGWVASTI
jgi:integrase/recombinase XerD